ncbi:hypothetical protein Rhe02_48080 [Rhizocola hellebori]|uniref:SCP domain-containing protein n=1 Tax=Rhizocola hellebori TaxID=1392758 RepID=A0A8J3QC02_9ACTN|nr:hypothetical protein [Rhizocola hellebori]GIH06741.1 hypothetical protein Rhe02_48080 [Rhizocola hellebori]
MKVRQVLAVLAVLVIGLLAGSLVSSVFAATPVATVGLRVPRSAPKAYLVVVGVDCASPIPTASQPLGGPTAVLPDAEKLIAANARAATVFGARRELGIEVVRAHVECARMIESNLDSARRAGPVDVALVRVILDASSLKDVEVHGDPTGKLIFGARSGEACVVGVHHASESWVAVMTPLPGGKCLP